MLSKTKLYVKEQSGGINSQVYTEEIITGNLIPLATNEMILIQEGATAHTAKKTSSFFSDHGIKFKTQSPHSPDLNPIERIWGILKMNLYVWNRKCA